jgi:hypothetical protein
MVLLGIDHIREELNGLPFREGKREVYVGSISEMLEEESEQAIAGHLRQFEQELRSQTLILTRHEDDRDALFVVQKLRTLAPDSSRTAEAMNWVAKITAVVLEMLGLDWEFLWACGT